MTASAIVVFAILAVTIGLFVADRLRLDLVALLALLALLIHGALLPEQGLSLAQGLAGFSNPVVLMIAGLFVVGGGLFQTGVADRLGRWLGKAAGRGELRLIAVIMLVAAVLSAFMSSTGTVAVMLPVVVTLARGAELSPSKLLLPLSFGALLGGMLTLIGTPPNIVVSNQLRAEGLEPFGFFSFSVPGLVMLAVGVGFMLLVGRHLLPEGRADGEGAAAGPDQMSGAQLVDDYELDDNILRFRVLAGSELAGQSLAEAGLRSRYQGTVLDIQRPTDDGPAPLAVAADTVLAEGDVLCVQVSEEALDEVKAREQRSLVIETAAGATLPRETMLVEVLLTPRSRLSGRTLKQTRFRDRYHANVLSIKRLGEPIEDNAADVVLRFGDTLLVEGRRRDLSALRDEHRNFVVVAEPRELREPLRNTRMAPVAVVIVVAMLLLMTFGIVPHVTAVLLAAVAMVLTRCLTMVQAYRTMNWESVVLIAAILPMSTALDRSGGLTLIVDGLVGLVGGAGPIVVMASLFVLTSLFSQVISNTATTVLVAPIAFEVAKVLQSQGTDASPRAFMMTVAIAASTAFATPIASPVNTLVMGPGGYRFGDFLKIGVLLQMLILVATLLVVPMLY